MQRKIAGMVAAALLASVSFGVRADVYADELGKCLVQSSSQEDKIALVRWVFANAALHPEVKAISALSQQERVAINKTAAQLYGKLLTKVCRSETKAAFKYGGTEAVKTSFNLLGQVAMRELMTDPAVLKGFGDFTQYMDKHALEEVFPAEKSK